MSAGARKNREILNASNLLGIKEGINKKRIRVQRRLPKHWQNQYRLSSIKPPSQIAKRKILLDAYSRLNLEFDIFHRGLVLSSTRCVSFMLLK